MSETTVSIPRQLADLNNSLKALSEKASFEQAQSVINNVMSLLGLDPSSSWNARRRLCSLRWCINVKHFSSRFAAATTDRRRSVPVLTLS